MLEKKEERSGKRLIIGLSGGLIVLFGALASLFSVYYSSREAQLTRLGEQLKTAREEIDVLKEENEELLVQAVGDYHRDGHAAVVGDQDIPSPLGDVLSSLVLNPVGHWGPQTGEKTAEGIKTHDSRSFTI